MTMLSLEVSSKSYKKIVFSVREIGKKLQISEYDSKEIGLAIKEILMY